MGLCASAYRVVRDAKGRTGIAVIFGVDYTDNPHRWEVLRGTMNDAATMKAFLEDVWGFSSRDIQMYCGQKECTREAILNALNALVEQAEGRNVFIGFSGHGKQTAVKGQSDFVETDGLDEALCGYDDWILDDELTPIVLNIAKASRRLFVFFDCCYSGGSLDLKVAPENMTFVGSSLEQEKSEADHVRAMETPSGTEYKYGSLATKWLDQTLRELGARASAQSIVDSMRKKRWSNNQQLPILLSGSPKQPLY